MSCSFLTTEHNKKVSRSIADDMIKEKKKKSVEEHKENEGKMRKKCLKSFFLRRI